MNNPDKSNPENNHNTPESKPLPPSIQRRRKNSRLYKRKTKAVTYDKMIVTVAFLVAMFMVLTKGCAGPMQNIVKFLGGQETTQTEEEEEEEEVNGQLNSKPQDKNINDSK
ncbi:MAG: hypothetical protein PF689_06540 [Deltaproteobacteria bacterium]|nr:hypothetical protein [Deltaproteobacteria bacterium]